MENNWGRHWLCPSHAYTHVYIYLHIYVGIHMWTEIHKKERKKSLSPCPRIYKGTHWWKVPRGLVWPERQICQGVTLMRLCGQVSSAQGVAIRREQRCVLGRYWPWDYLTRKSEILRTTPSQIFIWQVEKLRPNESRELPQDLAGFLRWEEAEVPSIEGLTWSNGDRLIISPIHLFNSLLL